jgi:hypothetical protein
MCVSQAAKFLTRVLMGMKELFGPDAPQTLNVKADLAGFLAELENFEEAEALFAEAARKLTEQLGAAHEWSIKATTGLNVLSKLRSTMGGNYIPGKFASADTVSVTAPPAKTTSPEPAKAPAQPAEGASKAAASGAGAQQPTGSTVAAQELSALRDTRLEAVKGPAQPAARKHLRGWLEKLPVELSQRERERLMREKRLSKAPGALAASGVRELRARARVCVCLRAQGADASRPWV